MVIPGGEGGGCVGESAQNGGFLGCWLNFISSTDGGYTGVNLYLLSCTHMIM